MMWKDCYRIGVEQIDQQHQDLFRMTENLLHNIERQAGPEEYRQAISFLREYVMFHFADEERYQRSIGYSGLEEHQRLHQTFANAALEFERHLEENGYPLAAVKELAGTLTAWLIYHVTDADQRIVHKELSLLGGGDRSCIASLSASMFDVLEKMAGLDPTSIQERRVERGGLQGEVFIRVGLVGDLKGYAVFAFSHQMALQLVELMTMTPMEEVDELVCSALAEIGNISSGNAATRLAQCGVNCDITAPVVSTNPEEFGQLEGIWLDTRIGGMEVALLLEDSPL